MDNNVTYEDDGYQHHVELAAMASSSSRPSLFNDCPNNLNSSSINMAQDTDENAVCDPPPCSDVNQKLELYRAVLDGDWKSASEILNRHPESIYVRIGTYGGSVLHTAVEFGVARMDFVEKLVEFMTSEAFVEKLVESMRSEAQAQQALAEAQRTLAQAQRTLARPDSVGATALFNAARADNIKAAKLLVKKNPRLPNIWQAGFDLVPLHTAVRYGHKELTLYLLSVTQDDESRSPFKNFPGFILLYRALTVGFNDVALYLVKRYPDLATCDFESACADEDKDFEDDFAPLTVLAKKPWAFRSGSRFNKWQRIVYHCVPVKLDHVLSRLLSQPSREGRENQAGDHDRATQMCCWTQFVKACQKVNAIFWELVGWLVPPPIKHIQETKTMHSQTLQLLNHLCTKVKDLEASRAEKIFRQSFNNGAKYGIPEILEEIIKVYPFALDYLDENVFQLAVSNRNEKIFNFICKTGMQRQLIERTRDDSKNNILHLAGKLAPPHRLSLVSGAALQMQRELHWFKEIEKYAPKSFNESINNEELTPTMIFIKEHEKLRKEAEKWMKGTANSYTLAAALIATVVFAAAITIPGGNHDNTGIPNFSKEKAFKIFAVSDALSLFLSISSVLIFLSILTARYTEDDFRFSLPRRLIYGLVTLFLSVTFMMIAYSWAIYLISGEKKAWILITLGAFACVPLTLFLIWQYPLLEELIYSTCGPGIFGKHSNHLIHRSRIMVRVFDTIAYFGIRIKIHD